MSESNHTGESLNTGGVVSTRVELDRLREALDYFDDKEVLRDLGAVDVVCAAARRFLALTETGPDYEAAAREWMGDEPPSEYPGGQKAWDALVAATIEQTIKPLVDAALADYLTEDE